MHKANETVLEINLTSLEHNLRYLRSKIEPSTKLMAVVKAYAYGNDSCEIAKFLESKGVEYFAVAYAYEGVALRKAGITTPILVLHSIPAQFEEIIEFHLEPNLYNKKVLEEFMSLMKHKGIQNYPIHLKFNTGLNRLGFEARDLNYLYDQLGQQNQLNIVSLFSHLAASEDLSVKDFTLKQISKFKDITDRFMNQFGFHPLLHILNTSGILNYADIGQFDMVRSGIGLYGYGNDPDYDQELKPIGTLKSIISQIHTVNEGDSVGYNMGFTATNTTRIGIIPVGHADGIGRHFGKQKGFLTIGSKRAPIIGNVCMDMLMVDLNGIDCEEGDEVIVFGGPVSAEDFAKTGNTISYELITGISQRIKRVIIK
ncbi:alanine racemase [Zhouia amylolytica]|uniref:Alanine racemase n=1 Tax=Zhouia amylolytica AD3 TaxID=1286632 RepID=W2ULB1_9FLAO|nr:alanine racemase [Zhouia amylolytica]ETN94783.1 alanine racemase [Zhouia amylolytica AD3]